MAAAEELLGDTMLENSLDLTDFSLTEPERRVPNHLLDTKIYAKLGRNAVLQTRPAVIHFDGFKTGKLHTRKLHVLNASSERQRMHIIPPTSPNFRIKYKKEDTLVPGLYLEITVEFQADQYDYYYDCIRIHSKAKENLVIPLHAYPVIDLDDFPRELHFPSTPVGETATKEIPLQCNARVNFEFKIFFVQRHPAFHVEPMSGYIKGGHKIIFKVSFSPMEYATAHAKIQFIVSQFNSSPLFCTFSGTSAPGLAKALIEENHQESKNVNLSDRVLDPRTLSPLGRSRNRKTDRKKNGIVQNNTHPKEITQDGYRFPTNLNNPAAVSYVLSQQQGKMKAKDIREAVKTRKESVPSTAQMKEAVFEHVVDQSVAEEQRNQLRWCVKIGDDPQTAVAQRKILEDRDKAIQEYEIARGDPQMRIEFDRSSTFTKLSRIQRQALLVPSSSPSFDLFINDEWNKRHTILQRFAQSGRKVIFRERARKHLKSLGHHMEKWKKGQFSTDRIKQHWRSPAKKLEEEKTARLQGWQEKPRGNWKELDDEQKMLSHLSLQIERDNIRLFSFPDYVDPNVKDDLSVDALGCVQTSSTTVNVKTRVPLYNLKVPQQYKLLGYCPHSVTSASYGYVPRGLARELRRGAMDEVTGVIRKDSETPPPIQDRLSTLEDIIENQDKETVTPRTAASLKKLKDIPEDNVISNATFEMEYQDRGIIETSLGYEDHNEYSSLSMPASFFRERKYHPMHIFNPEPGLRVYAQPLPHSEVDGDRKLLPIPTGTDNRSRIKLDRQDVIPGAMSWKRFPCQGLVALNSTPTLSNVYVPRWTDPFGDELIPLNTPPLLSELLPEDDITVEDEGEEEDVKSYAHVPTMEMIRAEFVTQEDCTEDDQDNSDIFPGSGKLPSTNNPQSRTGILSRNQRQQELDVFIRNRLDRLGARVKANAENLKSHVELNKDAPNRS